MKFLIYSTITMYLILAPTEILLKKFTSYRIVHTNNKINELENSIIMDIIAISSDESYFVLTKDSYLYTIDVETLSIKRKLFLPGLNSPQKIHIIDNEILVIDKNKKNYTLVHYKLDKSKLLRVSSIKIISIKPISIWSKFIIIDSNFKFNYYQDNKWELGSNIDSLPFKKPNSIDYSLSKQYSDHGYIITDRSNKKVSIYSKGFCYGDIREYYDSTFKLERTPQTAAFATGLCWAGNYHIMPSSNYWGSLLIAYKNKKGIEIYDIKNDWTTTILHELNKIYTFVLSIPFFPLRFIFGRQ